MHKYSIDKSLFPYSHFTPPIINVGTARFMGGLMRPPRWLKSSREGLITERVIEYGSVKDLRIYIFEPKKLENECPCLVYFHGGGFFFAGADYHYRLAEKYTLGLNCKTVFVDYSLSPKYKYPTQVEECYAAYLWVCDNAKSLGIDSARIAVGGDSAGGGIAAAVALMLRDRGAAVAPLFQLLVYPVTDRRMSGESYLRFTDTPMWNSRLSKIMWKAYIPEKFDGDLTYASPLEAVDHGRLPPAYIETAEFDCLNSEGIAYAEALRGSGIEVELNETEKTMHGFDIVLNSPLTVEAVKKRIAYMNKKFYGQ